MMYVTILVGENNMSMNFLRICFSWNKYCVDTSQNNIVISLYFQFVRYNFCFANHIREFLHFTKFPRHLQLPVAEQILCGKCFSDYICWVVSLLSLKKGLHNIWLLVIITSHARQKLSLALRSLKFLVCLSLTKYFRGCYETVSNSIIYVQLILEL